jgi:hypothetical protein
MQTVDSALLMCVYQKIIDDYGVPMPDTTRSDYTIFDHPDALSALFHPSRDTTRKDFPSFMIPVMIPLEDGERIEAVCHFLLIILTTDSDLPAL